MEQQTTGKWKIIRLIYLYLVSLIGLVVFLVGGVGLVDTGLKLLLNVDESYFGDAKQICRDPYRVGYYGKRLPVATPEISAGESVKPVDANSQEFKDCVKEEEDRQKKQEENNRRREVAQSLAMMILGTPVWLYHWFVIQREHKKQLV